MASTDLGSKATPVFGSLGPSSDLQAGKPIQPRSAILRPFAAVALGVFGAIVFFAIKSPVAHAAWEQISQLLTLHGKPAPASPAILSDHELSRLNDLIPQTQAQLLLERAINHYDGANDQIAQRVDQWRGKIKLDARLNPLFMTALNSNDLRVRAAAIEIDLAAQNVSKTPESVERFIAQSDGGQKSQRIWALWMLGLLGNRGVDSQRTGEALISHLQDPDVEIRHWAVEGLAYLGSDATIAPLLKTFHDDASPLVRERAACSLAQSGMLSQQQRETVVPSLLEFAEDSSLGADTRMWTFHALRDITGQSLGNDPVAWRNWYSNRN